MTRKVNHFVQNPAMVESLRRWGWEGNYALISHAGFVQFRPTDENYTKEIATASLRGDPIPCPAATANRQVIGTHRAKAFLMNWPNEEMYVFLLETTPTNAELEAWDVYWNNNNGHRPTVAQNEEYAMRMVDEGRTKYAAISRITGVPVARLQKMVRERNFDLNLYRIYGKATPKLTVPQFNCLAGVTANLPMEVTSDFIELVVAANLSTTRINDISKEIHSIRRFDDQRSYFVQALETFKLDIERSHRGERPNKPRPWYHTMRPSIANVAQTLARWDELPASEQEYAHKAIMALADLHLKVSTSGSL